MKRLDRLVVAQLIALMIVGTSGCASDLFASEDERYRAEVPDDYPGEDDEDLGLGVNKSALWMQDTGDVWLAARGKLETEIPVCWIDAPSGPDDTQARRDMVRDAIADNWEDDPNIDFTGWGECPPDGSSGIRIEVDDVVPRVKGFGRDLDGKDPGLYLNFTFGAGYFPSAGCDDWYDNNSHWHANSGEGTGRSGKDECIRSIALHEFGHVLGYWHEYTGYDPEERPYDPADDPTDACQFDTSEYSDDSIYYTEYDVDSIMDAGYCGKHLQTSISEWDSFGAGIAYGGPEHILSNGGTVAIRSYVGGKYMIRTSSSGVNASSGSIHGEDARFVLETVDGGDIVEVGEKIRIRASNGRYVRQNGSRVVLSTDADAASEWLVVKHGNTPSGGLISNASIRLRANNGKHLKSKDGGDTLRVFGGTGGSADWRIVGPFIPQPH